jgi:peptide/nickel transport system permease protein
LYFPGILTWETSLKVKLFLNDPLGGPRDPCKGYMSLLLSFVELVTGPSGSLVYHLATLFGIQFIVGVAFEHWNRHRRDSVAIRLLVTGIDFVFARILLILIVVLSRVGVLSLDTIIPPLERFLDLFTLLLVVGAFLPILERHSRLGVTLLLFMLLTITGVYVILGALWSQAGAQGIAYNSYWQASVWECLNIAVLILAIIAAMVWRGADWGLVICLFGLWLGAHVLEFAIPIADSHIAGWVRLSNLAALPLLAALVYRYALRASLAHTGGTVNLKSWLRWGASAARAGNHTLARRCFRAARDIDPDNIIALLWLGRLAHTRLESLALFGRVLELDPKNEQAHAGIRWARQRPLSGEPGGAQVGVKQRPGAKVQKSKQVPVQRARWSDRLISVTGMLLRFTWRLSTACVLLVALVFFVSLAMDLARGGGLQALASSAPSAADFTVNYLANLTQGDLGSIAPLYGSAPAVPITEELARALPRSLGLLAVALALAVLIGLTLGIGAGLRRKTRFSGLLVFFSVLGISTPSYFAAMLLIWFGVWLYRTTGMDFLPIHGFGWDAHLILPALVLAARPAANVMRLGYNALVEVLDADFVRTAHAKGLGPRVVLFRHVLRNASVPLLTTVAVSLRFSLAILPIVEYIFNWSGVGEELLTAIQTLDTTTVIGMVLPLALLFVLVNILLEILYLLLDPRLRVKEVGAI